jgi:DNA-binding transcriptional regulator YiaG
MPSIDRSTRPEVILRFRAEFGISQPALGDELGLSLSTIQRFEQRGAPRWMLYALIGLAVMKKGVEPMEVRRLRRALHLGIPRAGRLKQIFAAPPAPS